MLQRAVGRGDIWVTSLDHIAEWRRERATFSFDIQDKSEDGFVVKARCTSRGAVALQHPGDGTESIKLGENNKFSFQSSYRSVIGVLPGSNDELAKWLTNEGFAVEQHANLIYLCLCVGWHEPKGQTPAVGGFEICQGTSAPLLTVAQEVAQCNGN